MFIVLIQAKKNCRTQCESVFKSNTLNDFFSSNVSTYQVTVIRLREN